MSETRRVFPQREVPKGNPDQEQEAWLKHVADTERGSGVPDDDWAQAEEDARYADAADMRPAYEDRAKDAAEDDEDALDDAGVPPTPGGKGLAGIGDPRDERH